VDTLPHPPPDDACACCMVRRKGRTSQVTRFSVADAKRAKLWGKAGPWTEYPQRMLRFRALGFRLNDTFPDVLKGLKTVEELRDYPDDSREANMVPPPPKPVPPAKPAAENASTPAKYVPPAPRAAPVEVDTVRALAEEVKLRQDQWAALLARHGVTKLAAMTADQAAAVALELRRELVALSLAELAINLDDVRNDLPDVAADLPADLTAEEAVAVVSWLRARPEAHDPEPTDAEMSEVG
jgi:hypothetical protein